MIKIRELLTSREGFTLIELLIVIVVLGILAGIAVPRITGMRVRAEVSSIESNLRTLQNELEMHHIDNGTYPDDLDAENMTAWENLRGREGEGVISELVYDDENPIGYKITIKFVPDVLDIVPDMECIEEGDEYYWIFTPDEGIVKSIEEEEP